MSMPASKQPPLDRQPAKPLTNQTGRPKKDPAWVAPVEADPAVIAELRARAEHGLAECRAGLATDGDKVLDRLFPCKRPFTNLSATCPQPI